MITKYASNTPHSRLAPRLLVGKIGHPSPVTMYRAPGYRRTLRCRIVPITPGAKRFKSAGALFFMIDTSCLIDATNAKTVDGVLANVRQLGFDPSKIEYVFITQAHDDHYSGAARIKGATGATIGMSRQDLEFLEQKKLRPNHPQFQWSTHPAPPRDLVIVDGKVLEVGNAVFKFHLSPGHTPGSLSMEYTAYDGDRRYRVLTPGGLGFSYDPEWNEAYIASMERLKQNGPWDVVLSNHPFMMPGHLFERMRTVDGSRRSIHPLAFGPAAINEWLDSLLKIAREKAEFERAPRTR